MNHGFKRLKACKRAGDKSLNCRSFSRRGNRGHEVSSGASTWDALKGKYPQPKKLGGLRQPSPMIAFIEENRVMMNAGNLVRPIHYEN